MNLPECIPREGPARAVHRDVGCRPGSSTGADGTQPGAREEGSKGGNDRVVNAIMRCRANDNVVAEHIEGGLRAGRRVTKGTKERSARGGLSKERQRETKEEVEPVLEER